MESVLYMTFVCKPDSKSTSSSWTSILKPTISQSNHHTYSDVRRTSMFIVAARVAPVCFGEHKWFVGHALLFFSLATIVLAKFTNILLGRPSVVAAARQHKFEQLHRRFSGHEMSSGAQVS